ncbi:MAG: hypothetical protein PHF84_00320 [bacterium]|nr:hypothetical protein [bacterium]
MMKKIIFLFFLFTPALFSEPLIETDVLPDNRIQNIKSLALFHFDAKLVNSGRAELVDYLEISERFHQSLLDRFYRLNKVQIADADEKLSQTEEDSLSVQRGKYIPEYDEKKIKNRIETSQTPVKTMDAYLYGKIARFYEGKDFETSYIDITFFLVESRSKAILWTSGMKGCLKYVSETLVATIEKGDYSEPTLKEKKEFKWLNPYEQRVQSWALGYRPGYFMGLGEMGKRSENGWSHDINLLFRLPIWGVRNLYNQIDLMLIPSLQSGAEDDPLKKYTYNTYLPVIFSFIFRFDTRINRLSPFVSIGAGAGLIHTYYSGLGTEKESSSSINAVLQAGAGIEYTVYPGLFYIGNTRIRFNQLGFLCQVDFFHWFINDYSANGLDISLGIRYYF